MSTFNLRPVVDMSPSPSPTASTTSPDDHHHSPSHRAPVPPPVRPSPPASSTTGRVRRPFSPSSLRELDLSQSTDVQSRRYPAPPTGHDLMAMFPPPPPDNFPEMRAGPTSGYFQRQERAFFAQAGKEIVRVRLEVDLPHGAESDAGKSSSLSRAIPSTSSRPWPPAASSSSHAPSGSASQSPNISSSSAPPYPHPGSRSSPRGSLSNPAPLFPLSSSHSHPHSQASPPNLHPPGPLHPSATGVRTPPQDPSQLSSNPKSEYPQDDYDDDAWRRPMPYAERRRAGKHTRRVIVRT